MRILVIGQGGREHAMAWQMAQFDTTEHVFVAPGNAGTAHEDKVSNVAIAATDLPALAQFAKETAIDLTIVGPEAPLVAGITDYFTEHGLACFGPNQKASQLEGSKSFSKAFLKRHHIPTAGYACFTDASQAHAYLETQQYPVVIKADGLAAGKGVVIAQDKKEALEAIDGMLCQNTFGTAGQQIVIERFLEGEEASFMIITDGDTVLPFATSQDHKALLEGDQGPNTGGMGAYSPAPVVTPHAFETIMTHIVQPTLDGLRKDGIEYCGFLYIGLMMTDEGPYVLEFNCRLGDPETQPLMMRLQSNLADGCLAATQGQLNTVHLTWDHKSALGVVLASEGYPNQYPTQEVITGIEHTPSSEKVFHAGTQEKDGQLLTAGGRVLCVAATGETLAEAQKKAYQSCKNIHWPHCYYRNDIGHKALT